MSKFISKIENDVQDKDSAAWNLLCEYVDEVAFRDLEEFSPAEALGREHFSKIFTLPQSIKHLKKVKKIWLYGSHLKRIPPEIGGMESLEYFDPYTSYSLFWFPYEITKCRKLKDSRVSTRVLYGNYKNRKNFPNLKSNPVAYENAQYDCSICEKRIESDDFSQYWVTLYVGTDYLPLLANVCSDQCKEKIPIPNERYIQYPHKGGSKLKQPKLDD